MSTINYNQKRDLEQTFDRYLEAMERQDQEAMKNAWLQSKDDQLYSILGSFSGDEIAGNYISQLPDTVKAVRTGQSSMQVLMSTDQQAVVRTEYEVMLSMAEQEAAVIRTMLETQVYERKQGQWKLHYVHQSWKPDDMDGTGLSQQPEILSAMIAWLSEKQNSPVSVPRSLSSRESLLKELLRNNNEDPDEEFLQLQNRLISLRRQMGVQIVSTFGQPEAESSVFKGKLAVVQEEPGRLAADGLISFSSPKDLFDPLLALDAGMELERDMKAVMKIKPREILELCPYQLPVKGLTEIVMQPVFGLFTKVKKQKFLSLLQQALKRVEKQGWRTLIIDVNWHEQLHIPLHVVSDMMEILADQPFERIVLQCSHSSERKIFQTALETVEGRYTDLQTAGQESDKVCVPYSTDANTDCSDSVESSPDGCSH